MMRECKNDVIIHIGLTIIRNPLDILVMILQTEFICWHDLLQKVLKFVDIFSSYLQFNENWKLIDNGIK